MTTMLQELTKQGISVWIEDDQLRFKPKSKLTPALIEQIQANKDRIVQELQAASLYCSWLKKYVSGCELPCWAWDKNKSYSHTCEHFKRYMINTGRW